MLSLVIPTLDAARTLPAVLTAAEGAGEILIVDGGSADGTPDLARDATLIRAPRGRGRQMAAGARAAQGEWLLFLHADTLLPAGWRTAAEEFMSDPANRTRAACFRLAFDSGAPGARRLEKIVAWRTERLGLPYGDQGLLIAADFYRALGGHRPLPLMEDVDLVRRIGKKRLTQLPLAVLTSAARYEKDGWIFRPLRNLCCLALYYLGCPPEKILGLYR